MGVLATSGFFSIFILPEDETKSIKNEEYTHSSEVVLHTFLNLLIEGKVGEAEKHTIGETKTILNSNQQIQSKGRLLNTKIKKIFISDQYVQLESDVDMNTETGKDYGHYLVSMIKKNGEWKIYQMEELPVLWSEEHASDQLDILSSIIKQYLQNTSKADWESNLSLVSGKLKETAQQTFHQMPDFTSDINILEIKPLVQQKEESLVLVKYHLKNQFVEKDQEMVFEFKNISGEWKITKIVGAGS